MFEPGWDTTLSDFVFDHREQHHQRRQDSLSDLHSEAELSSLALLALSLMLNHTIEGAAQLL